jgi:Uma2 family endonuclease
METVHAIAPPVAVRTSLNIIALPDHTQLPESDGSIVENFQERPLSALLSSAITPLLRQRHPDGQYAIGSDSGIYWRLTDPLEKGAISPDWFYIPNVPPLLDGYFRRSYVMWQEHVAPLIVIEFVSKDGADERNQTPMKGKFWIYEKALRVPYYGIFDGWRRTLEVYHLVGGNYQLVEANEYGQYPIKELGVALGLWYGTYENLEVLWARWYDDEGRIIPTREESCMKAEMDRERLAERLRELGIDPESVLTT